MKRLGLILLIMSVVTFLTGCFSDVGGNHTDIDFTVVNIESIPEELLKLTEAKKTEPFTITMVIDGYLYIAEGFGTQPTGGYSITVTELYDDGKNIIVDNTLRGPAAGEAVNKIPTYPYIVLKIEYSDKNVEFK